MNRRNGPERAWRRFARSFVGTWLMAMGLCAATNLTLAATFTVDSTADTFDSGNTNCASPCTLRQAITVANNTAGVDTIAFNIPGSGEQLISITSALPSLEEAAQINGYTQPGAAVNTSANAFNGVLRVRVQGVGLSSSTGGIGICASGSSVRGLSLGGFPTNQISAGIRSNGTSCPGTVSNLSIAGNLIGLGTDGNTDIGGTVGISFLVVTNSTIGGSAIADRNVISGFTTGISLSNSSASIQVLNNLLGTNAADTQAVANAGAIFLGGVVNSTIGSTTAPNVIAYNSRGIQASGIATGNQWTGNIFRINAPGLGVDLNNDGAVNPNDLNDADSGANALQNFPVIATATQAGANLTVTGALDVGNTSDLNYELSVYATDRCDESGFGEGEIFLGVATRALRTTAESFSITLPYSGPTSGRRALTMLARHPTNGSSEFSQCFFFTPGQPLVVNTTDDVQDGICNAAHCSLRDALVQAAAESGPDTIHFAIAGAGPHRITPATAYAALSQPVLIDGYSQAGASANTDPLASNANLKIIIDVSGTGQTLFDATIAGSTIRGLSFAGSPSSGNAIIIARFATTITGNWFGVEPNGTTVATVSRSAIHIFGSGTVVGGAASADRNVFAGSTSTSPATVAVMDAASSNVTVENNLFGLLPNGLAAARNSSSLASSSVLNTAIVARNNTFGCANNHLVNFGTLVENNRFGLSTDGVTVPTGTCDAGRVLPRSNSRLQNNRIATSVVGGRGIEVGATSIGVVLDRNQIINVTTIEIDLGSDGPTTNDLLDADTGANNRQNFPSLTRAVRTAANQLQIDGNLHSLPSTTFRVQFFADAGTRRVTSGISYANARWVGTESIDLSTDASGNVAFQNLIVNFPDAGFLGAVSATATRLDGSSQMVETSELSPTIATFASGPSSFVVTNTDAIGPGSFVAAMQEAEAHPDVGTTPDVISFNIPGAGPHVITPAQSIFTVIQRLLIDGQTQPGATINSDPVGSNAQVPIELRNVSLQFSGSPDAEVRGLSLSTTTTMAQPFLQLGPTARVHGNFIGVRSDGLTLGAAISAAAFIDCIGGCGEIGGSTDARRNLIANPTSGDISAIRGGTSSPAVIQGNLIGMQRDGTTRLSAVANSFPNPIVSTPRAILSRVAVAPGDTIRSNTIGGGIVGIRLEGEGATVESNRIGGGIIGGTQIAFRNGSAGVWINGGAQHNVFANVIQNNGGDGIDVNTATTQARLVDNTMSANSGLAIDLGSDGVTANDALDVDSGANGAQNFPTITLAAQDVTGMTVSGTLASKPSTTYRIRFCFVQTADGSQQGECDAPIPSTSIDVTTAADGTAAFTTSAFAAVAGMTAVTATASELQGGRELTSEFAINRLIQRATDVVVASTPNPSFAGQAMTVTATVSSRVGGTAPNGTVNVTTSPNVGSCNIVSLASGVGSCQFTPNVSGPITLSAAYTGSTTALSSLGTSAHQVDRAPTTTTITNDTPDPSTPGSSFTVTFSTAAQVGVATGNVTVSASGGGSCVGALSGGQGFCVLTPSGTGNLTLTASYAGSALHLPSQDTEAHAVGAASSSTSIQSISPSVSVFGQPVTVTAQVTASIGSPSGPILVTDGAGASCEINAAVGSCQLVPVNVGSDITIRAEFAGNAGHTGSFATAAHVVQRAEVTVQIAASFRADNPSSAPVQHAPMRVPVAVVAAAPGAGTPSGTVLVESVLGDELCVIVLPATFCDLTPLGFGNTDFTASFVGDSHFNERLQSFAVDIIPSPLFGDSFECEDICP